jgi:sulfur relay (sulfurtransferase) complex TusBCD TusD component (DsrE family)
MKILSVAFLFFLFAAGNLYSQGNPGCGAAKTPDLYKPIKIGIVISTNDPESVWNALRLANFSLAENDTVSIFLLGKGVEISTIVDKKYDIKGPLDDFMGKGGKILACGTCMQSRKMEESKACPVSSLSDLYDLIRKSDKVLTF